MSRFTRHRKVIRLKQEEDNKIKLENAKKFDKAMDDYLKTIKIIKKDYPEYNKMSSENALKLFNEIFNRIHHELYIIPSKCEDEEDYIKIRKRF